MESRLCLYDYTILKLAKHVRMASRDFRFSNLFVIFLSFALLGFFFDSFFSKKKVSFVPLKFFVIITATATF
jgi:hypothetical protein